MASSLLLPIFLEAQEGKVRRACSAQRVLKYLAVLGGMWYVQFLIPPVTILFLEEKYKSLYNMIQICLCLHVFCFFFLFTCLCLPGCLPHLSTWLPAWLFTCLSTWVYAWLITSLFV